MKPGSKEKNTPTNFNEKDSKVIKGTTTGRMSEAEAKAFESTTPDMEVTIIASKKTVPRGYNAPVSDSKTGRKVTEIKKEREFGNVALSKKEKEGEKGANWAKSRKYRVENVSIKNRK